MAEPSTVLTGAAGHAPRARRLRRSALGNLLLPYLLAAPTVIVLLVLLAYPIARVVGLSLYDNYSPTRASGFVGLKNYAVMFGNPDFQVSVWNSLVFTAGSVVLHLVLGMTLAVLLNRRFNPTLRVFFRAVFMLPWLLVPTIVSIMWKLILNVSGPVNSLLQQVGLMQGEPAVWLGDSTLAMPSLIVANTWAGYAFFMLMLLAGLQSIPIELYEAAAVDGAGRWVSFWHITIPSLASTILTVVLLDTIWTFRHWDMPYLLTGGGPVNATLVLPLMTYREGFEGFRFGQSAAVAVIILAVTLIFAFFYLRYQAKVQEQS